MVQELVYNYNFWEKIEDILQLEQKNCTILKRNNICK
jgi:hypothetical protein